MADAQLTTATPKTKSQPSVHPVLAAVVLVFTIGLAYHNSLSGPFIFDDTLNITNNVKIRRLWPIWQAMWGPINSGVSGRPVVQISFAINYALHQFNVWGYHFVNLLLHLATSVLLFGTLQQMFLSRPLAHSFAARAIPLSLCATILWQVHPLLSDSVSYISGRTEVLAALFMLLTLYCAIRSAIATRLSRLWQIGALLACVIGCGCKEIMAAAPVLVLTYDRLFIAGSFHQAFRERRPMYIGLFASLLLIPLNLYMGNFHRDALTVEHIGSWNYLKVQSEVLVMYLRLSFWPHPLLIDYSGWPTNPSLGKVLPFAAIIVSLLAATLYGLVRGYKASYAGAWFFFILGPTSSVLPLPTEIATERRMYLPLMAICALAVVCAYRVLLWIGDRWSVQEKHVNWLGGLIVALITGAEIQSTLWRNEDYKDPVTIWSDVLLRRPTSRAYENLGFELAIRGEYPAARECLQQALHLRPENVKTMNTIASILVREGTPDEALKVLETARRTDPRDAAAYAKTGFIYKEKGRFSEAELYLREAVRLSPGGAQNIILLADILIAQGKLDEAERLYLAVLQLDPESLDARKGLETIKAARR